MTIKNETASGANQEQRPLPTGSVIEYQGECATVVRDDGGNSLVVQVDDSTQQWFWTFEGVSCTVVSIPAPEETPALEKIPVSLSIFDDEGGQVDTTDAELTVPQISDIVDHASQLILLWRQGKTMAQLEQVLSELDNALVVSSVLAEGAPA